MLHRIEQKLQKAIPFHLTRTGEHFFKLVNNQNAAIAENIQREREDNDRKALKKIWANLADYNNAINNINTITHNGARKVPPSLGSFFRDEARRRYQARKSVRLNAPDYLGSRHKRAVAAAVLLVGGVTPKNCCSELPTCEGVLAILMDELNGGLKKTIVELQ